MNHQDSDLLKALKHTVIRTPSPSPPIYPDRFPQKSPPAPRRSHSDHPNQSSHKPSSSSRPAVTHRSTSSQGLLNHPEKDDPFADKPTKQTKDAKGKVVPAKKSRHADVIDRLDPSSFWGGTIHHESAYDAAAPSRNKATSATAPMRAFDSAGQPVKPSTTNSSNPKLSTLASHTLARMGNVQFAPEHDKLAPEEQDDLGQEPDALEHAALPVLPSAEDRSGGMMGRGLKLIRSRSRSAERKLRGGDRSGAIPGVGSMPAEEDYYNARAKNHKNALANAWGVADPEPFEDFGHIAPGQTPKGETGLASASSSIWNGMESHSQSTTNPRSSSLSHPPFGSADDVGDSLDSLQGGYAARKKNGAYANNGPMPSPPLQGGGATGVTRTKSLMKRFKQMRENPNVPVPSADIDNGPPSPTTGVLSSSLPSASSNGTPYYFQRKPSFLNRKGRTPSNSSPPPPPSPPVVLSKEIDPFASNSMVTSPTDASFAHDGRDPFEQTAKALPSVPQDQILPPRPVRERAVSTGNRPGGPPPPPAPIMVPGSEGYTSTRGGWQDRSDGQREQRSGAALGRKASLMKRVLGRG